MVLMSAAVGGATFRVFRARPPLSIVTTKATLAEAKDHLPELIHYYRANPRKVAAALRALPLKTYGPRAYASHVPTARALLGKRDPDDVPLLALALKLDVPVWSNDRDFEGLGISAYPTAVLLKILGL
jgi:predicted nucleic acid-binding protein